MTCHHAPCDCVPERRDRPKMSSTPTPCSAVTEPLESGRVVERIKRESFDRQPGLRHRRRTTHQHEGQESIAWQVSPNHRLTTHDQPQAPLGQPIKGSIKGSESLTHFEAKDSDPLMDRPIPRHRHRKARPPRRQSLPPWPSREDSRRSLTAPAGRVARESSRPASPR